MSNPYCVLQFASTIKSRISPDLEKGNFLAWLVVVSSLLLCHLMSCQCLSIRRRRGGRRRGERGRDRRVGATVQLSERSRRGEGADGAARQAAQD